ncbi:flagellar hook-associated protein FlgK [Paenibacillus sp. JSM ZJ436]|uniref:flagellar hook-associated protein FlgK n=1 Tax=Paenibacillus sp. JSM ZJ436 TaxID=3376190 RepID=UPI003793E0C3
MASTFHSIETAKRSLFTQTAALSTTGHNIANANTEGFSRQTVQMKASRPMEAYGLNRSLAPGQLGTGVEFTSIERVREAFLDHQFRGENSSLGSWATQANTLDKLQAIINEPSETGIRTVLDNFWNSFSELSKNPEDPTARKVVKQTAESLADALNHMSRQLDNLDRDLTTNVSVKASEIQSYINSISDMNRAITRVESLGNHANDLRDQRDLLTDKLSKIINITVVDTPQGYNVSLGGQALLEGAGTPQTVDSAFLTGAYSSGMMTGGEVHGMLISRDSFVSDYRNQINNLANTLMNGDVQVPIPAGSVPPEGSVFTVDAIFMVNGQPTTVTAGQPVPANAVLTTGITTVVKGFNGLHQLGYTMDGAADPGPPFFAGTGAGDIALNPEIASNPDKIATSMRLDVTTGNVVRGNNTLASLLANLKISKFTLPGSNNEATVDALFSSMVGQLGVRGQEANRQTENASFLTTQVNNNRQSVSGVSLDEEMGNMIKFQHAYSAAARFMTTFDQLLDKLINSTGVVGR